MRWKFHPFLEYDELDIVDVEAELLTNEEIEKKIDKNEEI